MKWVTWNEASESPGDGREGDLVPNPAAASDPPGSDGDARPDQAMVDTGAAVLPAAPASGPAIGTAPVDAVSDPVPVRSATVIPLSAPHSATMPDSELVTTPAIAEKAARAEGGPDLRAGDGTTGEADETVVPGGGARHGSDAGPASTMAVPADGPDIVDDPSSFETGDPETDAANSIDAIVSGLSEIGGVVGTLATSAARLKVLTRGMESLAERHAEAERSLDKVRGEYNLARSRLVFAEGELRRRAEEAEQLAGRLARSDARVVELEGEGRALADESLRLYVEKTRLEERLERLEKTHKISRSDLGVVTRERDQLRAAAERSSLPSEEKDRDLADRDIRIGALAAAHERLEADLLARNALVATQEERIDRLSGESSRLAARVEELTLAARTSATAADNRAKSLAARLSEAEAAAEGLRAKMAFLEQSAETARADFRDLSARHRLLSDGHAESIARGRAQADEILRLKAELAGLEPTESRDKSGKGSGAGVPNASKGGGDTAAGANADADAAVTRSGEAGAASQGQESANNTAGGDGGARSPNSDAARRTASEPVGAKSRGRSASPSQSPIAGDTPPFAGRDASGGPTADDAGSKDAGEGGLFVAAKG